MVGNLEGLIQAIVGKGLYEQYTQRQIAGEVYARSHLACGQRYAQTPQTRALPHASLLRASPTLCRSDAADTPPTDVSAPKSASTTSSSKSRPSSTTTLGRSPLLRPIEPALMPEYNIVHKHCSQITGDLEPGNPYIMQSYEYGPLDIGPAIGFQAPTTHRRIRAPPRKVTDLESLPPLSSEVAAEIARRVKVREQAGVFAGIREAQEKESENQRRANRAAQLRVPPYVAHILTSYSAEDIEAALLSEPPQGPLIRPERKQLRAQRDRYLGQAGNHAGDTLKQGHVRWAPEPASQRRRDSTLLEKKSHGGKQTNLRDGSRDF
ncbi:hypothetical protein HO173_007409 [Letharia columbiana]|uniref:Uncharacterized protein n=1 Tax=Letharia columbiana TaxID=112416 RepID=A0A8H6FT99_9LECA|nr:uncharacterized protein HO173_007409 [Letharia columbiana]KAF6234376.1 hypothetical protein HO173_007409 [Letharia columbiana]